MTERMRPEGLTVLIAVLVINALVTGAHFLVMFMGGLSPNVDMDFMTPIAIADIVVTVIPSLVAAFGLWHLRRWGWILALIVSGGYFHGMVLLLARSVVKGQVSSMSFISVYFIAFTALLVSYLWRKRNLFQVSPADA
ncbi:MAG: hypothetical protein ACT4QD_26190 [Acidobacteriota bacterium]